MILGDYHTHTTYSHGKGSVDDNCRAAIAAGLKEIAITDHGFKHMRFNVERKEWRGILRDVSIAREKYPQLKIYLGMETNLLGGDGQIDVTDDDLSTLDMLVCGYHKLVKAQSHASFWSFNLPVFLGGALHLSSKKRKIKTTDAFIKALEKYPISVLSHPALGVAVDLRELARAAAHFGAYIELNGKGIAFSAADAHMMLKEGCEFLADSDAHSPQRVGECQKPLQFIKDAAIPWERIANWDKLPVLRKTANINNK